MREALDLGVTLFDAADTYGNGRSEELLAQAFETPAQRDRIVIATKVGYNFYDHGDERGRGQREIPHDFSLPFIRRAVDEALRRLKTDRIDILQLHNIRMEQAEDGALWGLLETPPQGGEDPRARRRPRARDRLALRGHRGDAAEQAPHPPAHPQPPGAAPRQADDGRGRKPRHPLPDPRPPLQRDAGGQVHRRHRLPSERPPQPPPALVAAERIQKVDQLRFLEGPDRTLGQAALQWLLADERVGSCLPNIYDREQLAEFAKAPEDAPAHAGGNGAGSRRSSPGTSACRRSPAATRVRWSGPSPWRPERNP